MAIVNNHLTQIGDILLIHPTNPFVGVDELVSYSDDVDGVTGTRLFEKYFRWSVVGFLWSDWIPLSNTNLAGINSEFTPQDPLFLQFQYRRVGSDDTGVLSFNSIQINATYIDIECGDAFNDSPFVNFFTCCCSAEIFPWCVNVLEKLYEQGIVPNYINRGDTDNYLDDIHYLQFWRTVACFFSMFVNYARVFEDFYNREILLRRYLEQRNVYLCGSETLEQLQYIANNIHIQFRDRLTQNSIIEQQNINGEILRLLCYEGCNEFIRAYRGFFDAGWVLDRASPEFRDVYYYNAFYKGYEQFYGFSDISNYQTYNTGETISNAALTLPPDSGLGTDVLLDVDADKLINVNHLLNYMLTIDLEIDDNTSENITVGILCLTSEDAETEPQNIYTGDFSRYYVQNISVNQADTVYPLRFALLSSTATPREEVDAILSVGVGYHKRMTKDVCKVLPFIICTDNDTGTVTLHDFKFSLATTPYDFGFLDSHGMLEFFIRNNNGRYSQRQIISIFRQYFTPYNWGLNVEFLQ